MTLVRLIEGYPEVNPLISQTPHNLGIWEGIQFTTEPVKECDYLVIINCLDRDVQVNCPNKNIWAIIQEPPTEQFDYFYKHTDRYSRIYTPDVNKKGNIYIHSDGAIGWWIGKDYDFLTSDEIPEKNLNLSWLTNADTFIEGQLKRLNFWNYIQNSNLDIDFFGKGFPPPVKPIAKWDGVAPYKYTLAIENYSGLYYWSEKITDAFLAYTMPIYYGCTNITDYFPKESFVSIDINQPEQAVEIIRETINSDLWLRNRDAVIYARELVLKKYNLFAFLAEEIIEDQQKNESNVQVVKKCIKLKRDQPILYREDVVKSVNLLLAISRKILPKSLRNWLWLKIGKKLFYS
ncbi:glycosyltransferase family 10 [Nodularia harveyana UHCC-0300]|uniref:Glycosyltransferase family 10 n=1 Tax=Nodularia harveyana UHCC-0300 TaxID=2974287 RepID=A0ABU5UI77_9CYAN|nr:glycosyltransferase family 10 [Nodularia harveyana]MEA5583195.1 glycosyltransferase family 10 [Nodularia harveyana UHCC-0300]